MKPPSLPEVRNACEAVTKAASRVNTELAFASLSTPTAQALAGAVRPHLGELRAALQEAERVIASAEKEAGR